MSTNIFNLCSHLEINIQNPNTVFKITIYRTKQTNNAKIHTKFRQKKGNLWIFKKIKILFYYLLCILCIIGGAESPAQCSYEQNTTVAAPAAAAMFRLAPPQNCSARRWLGWLRRRCCRCRCCRCCRYCGILFIDVFRLILSIILYLVLINQ